MPEPQDTERPGSQAEPRSEKEAESRDPQSEPEPGDSPLRRERTRVDEMGIPPLWAVGGEKGRARELKKQLAAAEEALENARADARDAHEKYLRVAAEMENMRRRHQQDRTDQVLYGNADLILRILPLLDNFHRALDHAPESAIEDPALKPWVSGLLMVVRQFEDILEGAGVVGIEAVGKQFDPSMHQAVMAEASVDHEDGQVIAELQRGYRLRDRVLRPSMVKIANNQ